MNFSNIARQLNEDTESTRAAATSSEKAQEGKNKQIEGTERRRQAQKAQMAQQGSTPVKSDISYTSEEARAERETEKMLRDSKSDWRTELNEAIGPDEEGNHPFVDVMPFINQKAEELKRQLKGAAKMEGGKVAKMANEGALNPFQVHFDKDGKEYTSKGSKSAADRIAKNTASNRKSGPMSRDPYKARPGESD